MLTHEKRDRPSISLAGILKTKKLNQETVETNNYKL